jgi:hypothetical protein
VNFWETKYPIIRLTDSCESGQGGDCEIGLGAGIHDKCGISDISSAVTTGEEYQTVETLEVKNQLIFRLVNVWQ